jgi:maltodextrin utilization protein YvdJ
VLKIFLTYNSAEIYDRKRRKTVHRSWSKAPIAAACSKLSGKCGKTIIIEVQCKISRKFCLQLSSCHVWTDSSEGANSVSVPESLSERFKNKVHFMESSFKNWTQYIIWEYYMLQLNGNNSTGFCVKTRRKVHSENTHYWAIHKLKSSTYKNTEQ